jgi:hypothetical protein
MKSKYRTEFSGQKRHDSLDRTAQTGGDRQVRKTRTRKRQLWKVKLYYRNMALPTIKGSSL